MKLGVIQVKNGAVGRHLVLPQQSVVRFVEAHLVRYAPLVFFFQAEDGIRDVAVTGVDVCSSDLVLARKKFVFRNSRWPTTSRTCSIRFAAAIERIARAEKSPDSAAFATIGNTFGKMTVG